MRDFRRPFLLLGMVLAHSPLRAQPPGAELRFDIGALDRTADPCTDFYSFACGGWLARNPIPPDRSYSAVFQQMREVNQRRVREILEGAASPDKGRTPADRQIGDYYSSCLDERAIESKGRAPLQQELARIEVITTPRRLAEEIAHLQGFGIDPVFSFGPDQKLEDARSVIVYLDQSGLSLSEPADYTEDVVERVRIRGEYLAHLEEVFRRAGESTEAAIRSAQSVLLIETRLARASLTPLERRDRRAWYHEMDLAGLERLSPAFPWDAYFSAVGVVPTGVLNVAVPRTFQAIDGLMTSVPLSAWRSYLRWELLRLATPFLPARFRDAEFAFYGRTLRGQAQPRTRPDQCVDLLNRDLGQVVGRAYVARYFPSSSREQVLALVERLRRAMNADFQRIPWMGPRTRLEAMQKLEQLRVMIGYPDRWRDYSGLRIARGDALGNALRAQEFEFQRQRAKIGRPVDKDEFYELPQGVEGYHDNPLNVVVFTAGILQPPFYDPRVDEAVTYGWTGGVIGHELSHAFDDKGHLFDGAGNMRDWWSPEDARSYGEHAACFVRQYSSYNAVDGIKVNGELTLGENIADNGGLQLARQAFEEERSPDLSAIDGFSPEQRFFLGWAQWRCMNVSSKTAAIWARTDGHSPARWRVNGVVSNMPAFARAYQCKPSDPMVNAEPCRIW